MVTAAVREESKKALERIRDEVGVDRRSLWAALIAAMEEITAEQVEVIATRLRDEAKPIRLSEMCRIIDAALPKPSKFFDAVALEYLFPAGGYGTSDKPGRSVSEILSGEFAAVFHDLYALNAADIIDDRTKVDLTTGKVDQRFRTTAFGKVYGNAYRKLITDRLGKHELNGYVLVPAPAGVGRAIVKELDNETPQ